MSDSIPARIAKSFDESIKSEDITLYEAESVYEVDDDPSIKVDSVPDHLYKQYIHVVPTLAGKPGAPPETPDLSKVGPDKEDPLKGPDFGKNEKIMDLEEGGRKYALLHNLHAMLPEHFMLVPHFSEGESFRPQTSDLIPEDLAVAWKVVQAYADDGREAACFFNGGPYAGASQPHLHIQFAPFQQSRPPACEALARYFPAPYSEANATPIRLPVPWLHFYLSLPQSVQSSSSTSSLSPAATQDLHTTYQALRKASQAWMKEQNPSTLLEEGPKRESFNLLLTSKYMHLVPRTDRLVKIPRFASAREIHETDKEEEKEEKRNLAFSLNGFDYLGWNFVGSEEERQDLMKHGVARTLCKAGYRNEEYGKET
ncbi:hypothetical protein JCM11641_004968 [Rhodosporidiobolus odoratus]